MGKGGDKESADANIYRKRLAVAQGELEGYSCKVEGFKRALEEIEMQLADKSLQVAMLKSVITDSDNPAALECRLIEALEQNQQLQLQLKEVTAELNSAHTVMSAQATPVSAQHQAQRCRWHDKNPSDSSSDQQQSQQQDCQAIQLLMLRKALTTANMRLTSNGLLPVAATCDLLENEDAADSWPGDHGIAFACYTPAQPATAAATHPCSSNPSSSVKCADNLAPDLPALCLLSKLSAASVDGATTPLSGGGQRFLHNSSRCSTPVDASTPGENSARDSHQAYCADAACVVVVAPGSGSGRATCSKATGTPAAALTPCTWRAKESKDYSSSAEDDDSVFGSELSDALDTGELGMYPGSDSYSDNASSMQAPVLDNPLFLHSVAECTG